MQDPLKPSIREEVTLAQFEISKAYWKELAVVAHDRILDILPRNVAAPPQPRTPKLPHRIFDVLGRYAIALFDCEHSHHALFYLHTLDGIANRTEETLKRNILEFESGSTGRYSLTFHAALDEMVRAFREKLQEHIKTLPQPLILGLLVPGPGPLPQPGPAASLSEKEATIQKRKKQRAGKLLPILSGKGWTASRWATETGIDPSIIYDYMKGLSNPRPGTRNEMAQALEIASSELPE
jgi:hypothetical protein